MSDCLYQTIVVYNYTCPGEMLVVWLHVTNVWAVYGPVVGISWQIPHPWHCSTHFPWLLCSWGYD